jgi:hypothetical protein
MRGAAIHDL